MNVNLWEVIGEQHVEIRALRQMLAERDQQLAALTGELAAISGNPPPDATRDMPGTIAAEEPDGA